MHIQISLKAASVNANLTIIEASRLIGVGKDRLLKWEKAPHLVNALYQKKISETYEIPIDYIFFGI